MIKIAAEGVTYKSLEAESNHSLKQVKIVIYFLN
jgi:hypothetical protein